MVSGDISGIQLYRFLTIVFYSTLQSQTFVHHWLSAYFAAGAVESLAPMNCGLLKATLCCLSFQKDVV